MPIDRAILEGWYAGEEIAGAFFGLNESVIAPPGNIDRDRASVISLESVEPDVTYLVERTDGSEAVVRQEELAFLLYMPMLNEGTDVWRPVAGKRLSRSIAEVLSVCPDDESWQFPAGTRVVFEERQLSRELCLVAVREAADDA